MTKSFTIPVTGLWIIAWLMMGLPPLHRWDAALVSLIVCLGLDSLKAFGSEAR